MGHRVGGTRGPPVRFVHQRTDDPVRRHLLGAMWSAPTECSTPLNYAPGGSVRHRTDPSPTRIYSGVMDLHRRHSMILRDTLIAAALAVTLLTSAGCAVSRGQETTGQYIDDSAITAGV